MSSGWPPIDGTPRNLKVLFPEASAVVRNRAGLWAGVDGKRVGLRQGVLAAPPFVARLVWTSGEWVRPLDSVAPPEDSAARGRALLDAMAKARVGGTFWGGRPEIDDRAVLVCLPEDGQIRARMLAYLRERHAAESIHVLNGSPCDPWPLIEACENIHVGDDTPLALLALAAGKRVTCHAATSLSGWGATEDLEGVERRGEASIGALAAQLLLRARYADPFRDRLCPLEESIAMLDDWRRAQARKHGIASVVGIGFWKKRHVRALLDAGGAPLVFAGSAAQAVKHAAERGGAVVSWPSTAPPGLAEAAVMARTPVWRIEDGFIRSAGLGVHGVPPCSVAVDRLGAHYDPRTPSDLEAILQQTTFTPQVLSRAAALCEALVARGVSKYNVAGAAGRAITLPQGRRAVLVPGQVMDDASVLAGGLGIASNLELLQRVRARAPDAFIIYKPHPDVLSGHRAGAIRRADAERHADTVVTDAAIPALLDQVQEVHTLSSLTGFEALLRRRRVVAYGHPFYAGWGLTEDVVPVPRRARRLTLTELAAGALILYPLYIDPVTMLPCSVELLLERLGDPRLRRDRLRVWLRQALGGFRRMRLRGSLAAEWC